MQGLNIPKEFTLMRTFDQMNAAKIMALPIGLVILLLGWLQPQLLLLDSPFGLAFYLTDLLGKWQPGLLWAPNHRILAITCAIAWPMLFSALTGYGIAWVAGRLWCQDTKPSRFHALLFVVVVFGLIFSVRGSPGAYFVSYFGYTTANY